MLINAGICCHFFLFAVIMKPRKADPSVRRPTIVQIIGARVLSNIKFRFFLGHMFLWNVGFMIIFSLLGTFVNEKSGLTQEEAALIGIFIGILNTIGRVVSVPLERCLSPLKVYVATAILMGLFQMLIASGFSLAGFAIPASAAGFFFGIMVSFMPVTKSSVLYVRWLIDRWIDLLIDWFITRWMDWLTDWSIYWLLAWLIDWLTDGFRKDWIYLTSAYLKERSSSLCLGIVWLIARFFSNYQLSLAAHCNAARKALEWYFSGHGMCLFNSVSLIYMHQLAESRKASCGLRLCAHIEIHRAKGQKKSDDVAEKILKIAYAKTNW